MRFQHTPQPSNKKTQLGGGGCLEPPQPGACKTPEVPQCSPQGAAGFGGATGGLGGANAGELGDMEVGDGATMPLKMHLKILYLKEGLILQGFSVAFGYLVPLRLQPKLGGGNSNIL